MPDYRNRPPVDEPRDIVPAFRAPEFVLCAAVVIVAGFAGLLAAVAGGFAW